MIELDNTLKIPGGMVRLEGQDVSTPESERWVHPIQPDNKSQLLEIALGIE